MFRLASLRAIVGLAALGFRADPSAALLAATTLPFEFASGALHALALKAMTDAAVAGDTRAAVLAALFIAAIASARSAAATAWSAARMRLGERAGMRMQRRLGELTAAIPTIEHFERPDYLRQVTLVRQDSGWLADLFAALVHHGSRIGRLALSVSLLAALHPILAALLLFGIPSLIATAHAQRLRRRADEAVAEPRRLEVHLQSEAWGASPGKELRVFGLADELLERHRRVRAAVDRVEDATSLQVAIATGAGWLVFAAGFVGAIAFVVAQALAGRATAGDVVLAATLAAQVNGSVADLAGTVSWATRSLTVAQRYLWLADYARRATHRRRPSAPVPDRLEHGITLREVTFTYPGTDHVVLDRVSLHLPAGATVALVGENGAGKTTVVKLITGLYRPDAGEILVDGTPLDALDVAAWRQRTAAGFQDYARFMLLVRESVGVGDTTRVEDPVVVGAALERARAADVIAQLPHGLETQLGRHFHGIRHANYPGAALSDGQWQKLALGRSMMRETPLLLVLDEPTASLDAPTEHALFERYAGEAGRATAASGDLGKPHSGAGGDAGVRRTHVGGITVLVSHRFSTVRMADLIVVLEKGRVAASGSHQELMAQAGPYAELYELQARAYR